jgi:hypothetical protein
MKKFYVIDKNNFSVKEFEVPVYYRYSNDPEESIDYRYAREDLLKLGYLFFELEEGEKITLEEIFEDYDVEDIRSYYIENFYVPSNMIDLMDYCTDDALKAFFISQIRSCCLDNFNNNILSFE